MGKLPHLIKAASSLPAWVKMALTGGEAGSISTS
jgi:hypothetical protein